MAAVATAVAVSLDELNKSVALFTWLENGERRRGTKV